MIKIVEGDLLQASENILAHQVNCMGVMGSGVARQVRGKHPNVFEAYKEKCQKPYHINMGRCQVVQIGQNRYVANLFGQYKYGVVGVHTSKESLYQSLCLLRDFAEERNFSVALPYKIGCGRGGGNWDEVYKIIQDIFEDTSVDVTIYRL